MPLPPVRSAIRPSGHRTRPAARAALATATAVAAGMMALNGSLPASAVPAAAGSAAARPAASRHPGHRAGHGRSDPFSPAYRHAYRQGVVPVIGRLGRMRAWTGRHSTGARVIVGTQLRYGGGTDGIGVTTGHEKVYLVFWGSQWGTRATDSGGNLTLSGDPSGTAPYLQQLLKGLGTGGETWSGVATQYCQGVAAGATSCPASNMQHVAYPTGGALAGVWADESSAEPNQASGHQIGAEAVRAAAHFGNETAASNRNAQYLILSPTRTHPDGFNTASGNFCGWHDWNGDATLPGGPVASPYGHIAFSNLPYVTDAGRACGQNFVSSGRAGQLDGVSIVGGHEYAETITDQDPAGGWTDAAGNEAADLCEWNSGPGAKSADLSLPTGSFAMQSLWVNGTGTSAGTCEFSHAIVRGGGGGKNTVSVTSPGGQRTARGGLVSLSIRAADSAAGQSLSFAATGLPAGLTISGSTGSITGRPTRVGIYSVNVTATDPTGATGSAAFTWTVTVGAGFLARLLASYPGGSLLRTLTRLLLVALADAKSAGHRD
ncbi:MAG TPA: Ig domain-containing protein [Streptosporangiaceae bacterium]|nr:Ig domain-containing protein [Streptosporangiaceae bacterium]